MLPTIKLAPPTIDLKLLLRYIDELKSNLASSNFLKSQGNEEEINVEYLTEMAKVLGLLESAQYEITLLISDVKKIQNFASSPLSPENKKSMEQLEAMLKGNLPHDDFGGLGELVPFTPRKPRGSSNN